MHIQFNKAPAIIAPSVRLIVGREINLSVSLIGEEGREDKGVIKITIINRVEYAAVSIVANRKIKEINELKFKNRDLSIIISFE